MELKVRIYSPWAFTENEFEKRDINHQKYLRNTTLYTHARIAIFTMKLSYTNHLIYFGLKRGRRHRSETPGEVIESQRRRYDESR